tara:strand:- start:2206 stop:2829 length:624 start_codon:yes stop_codon:yes gene_type:complete
MTVEKFYNAVNQLGLSRDFLFRVIQCPGANFTTPGGDDIAPVFARTAAFPGRTIEDKVVNYYGQEFHLGGRALYTNAAGFPIEFYCDAQYRLREAMETLSRAAFTEGAGNMGLQGSSIVLRPISPNSNAKDPGALAHIGAMEGREALGAGFNGRGLTNNNARGGSPGNVTLHGVQIRDIGEISYLIADGTGDVVNFTASFAYQWYTF